MLAYLRFIITIEIYNYPTRYDWIKTIDPLIYADVDFNAVHRCTNGSHFILQSLHPSNHRNATLRWQSVSCFGLVQW